MKVKIEDIARGLYFGKDKRSQVISRPGAEIEILLTDSRSLRRPETSLFFAIRTEGGNDGHKYVEELYERGVRNFVVEYLPESLKDKNDVNIIFTEDSVGALQKVGAGLERGDTEFVAITGSRGKTALKELLFQLMEPFRKVSRSPRSYNSRIGVPISLWEVAPDSEIALIEAGISCKGEMEQLAGIIRPKTVMFTNIGEEHEESFTSLQELAEEKARIAQGEEVKTIIYEYDNKLISEALKPYIKDKETITWSITSPEADVYVRAQETTGKEKRVIYTFKGEEKVFSAEFEHDWELKNIAAALAFMIHENIAPEILVKRFAEIKKAGTRLDVTEGVNGCTLIKDSYVNDLSTLPAALDFLQRSRREGQKTTLLTGSLFTIMERERNDYEEASRLIKESRIDRVIGVGKNISTYRDLFPEGSEFYETAEEFLTANSPSDFVGERILIKGDDEDGFSEIKKMLEARTHETVLEVNLDSLVKNYNYFRSFLAPGTGIVAMVKASGYGAGSVEIAGTLQDAGAAYLAVAVVDEGAELRRRGITMPIMVMNPKVMDYDALFANCLEPEIYSFPMLEEVRREAAKRGIKEYPVHIKLDTGMHRMGFMKDETDRLITALKRGDEIKVGSLFSHLAGADSPDLDYYTRMQFDLFDNITGRIMAELGYPVKRHILNSAGIIRFPERHYDMVRLGIGLYGANTLPPEIEKPLANVSTLRTVIISLRERRSGETIGYGRKGVLEKDSLIATIPVGYADGLWRTFGNGKISVYVNGKFAPITGNICMDACMIDVTGIECKEGDAVEIFGDHAPLQRMADAADTIPYEILTSVSPRVKRVYFRE